jgi:protein-histidine pros-kinase
MGLGAKLNVVLLCVFVLGLALFYFLSEPFLVKAAEEEVLTRARIMMEGAAGIRKYTAEEVAPLLTPHMRKQFYPQTVAAYAAMKNFTVLREGFPDYLYREVSLNPTNPKSRALEWEADLIHEFNAFPNKRDLVTHRDTPEDDSSSSPVRCAWSTSACRATAGRTMRRRAS